MTELKDYEVAVLCVPPYILDRIALDPTVYNKPPFICLTTATIEPGNVDPDAPVEIKYEHAHFERYEGFFKGNQVGYFAFPKHRQSREDDK